MVSVESDLDGSNVTVTIHVSNMRVFRLLRKQIFITRAMREDAECGDKETEEMIEIVDWLQQVSEER